MHIGDFKVGRGQTYVIAEIGNNHNGDVDLAIELIDLAKQAGVNCVKFQMRNMKEVYRSRSLEKKGDDLGSEYIIDLLNKFELSLNAHQKIFDYCSNNQIDYMCTPWDGKSIDILEGFGVKGYKVASADLTNIPLIKKLVQTKKPLVLSTGMSTELEIQTTCDYLNRTNTEFSLLHCNSTYPAPFDDINLNWMPKLKEIHQIVGYSGHERGINVSIAAVALGAAIIERHFTLDRKMEGPDHAASLEPKEFGLLVEGIRQVESALGTGQERKVSQGELINRENLGKSLLSSRKLEVGQIITAEDIVVKSPGQGMSPQFMDRLIGKAVTRPMNKEDFFFLTDLDETRVQPHDYSFKRPWGIPVRHHDYKTFSGLISPEIWEVHLSYSDMELENSDYFKINTDAELIVHAPELFAKSKLMDLAAVNATDREYSIRETQKVIDQTRNLMKFFPKTERCLIVANVGGFSLDAPLDPNQITERYEILAESLLKLDSHDVELIPQTMAPFPWHFGGQRFQNLFLHADDIVKKCTDLNLRICLDVSHSKLACNFFQTDYAEFITKVAPYTAHIHMGDAKGVNGEGLGLGDGEIDLPQLCSLLNQHCSTASFIPEIWQGHKNQGEGFWKALIELEKWL